MKGAVVVSGAVARRVEFGGHVWALLQWALGFRRMGWKVLFLDRLDPQPGLRGSLRMRRFLEVMDFFGLGEDYALDLGPHDAPVGLPRKEVTRRVKEADFLLDIMGYLGEDDLLARARRRVFLDIDPGFPQMWRATGLTDPFARHDVFVTVGANVGRPGCRIPTCGLRWITTLPPVVLDLWPPARDAGTRFTTVGSWRGPWDPVHYEGEIYGLRVHEFRRFAEVPGQSGLPFEIALDIDPADARDADRLRAGGWRLRDPGEVATPVSYRRFLRDSRAEFMVAKGMYVRSGSGWISDRTACYLASGRPAVVQDTGQAETLETGSGLVTFATPEEAVAATLDVNARWSQHARAARDLAVQRFDSRRVLGRLAAAVAA